MSWNSFLRKKEYLINVTNAIKMVIVPFIETLPRFCFKLSAFKNVKYLITRALQSE